MFSRGGFTLRRFRKGDEEGVVRVIRAAMPVFDSYGLSAGEWLEGGGGVDPENTYVAESRGIIVSVVQVAVKNIVLGSTSMPVAGIANVSTMPGYRGRGLATSLLQHVLRDMEGRGISLAALFADLGGPAYRIYRRLSFDPIHVFTTPVCMLGDMRRAAEYCWRHSGSKTWAPRRSPEDLYEDYLEKYNGMVVRSEEYWKWVWSSRPWYTWFKLGSEGYRYVETGSGGYAMYAVWGKTRLAGVRDKRVIHVGEMLFPSTPDACLLLEKLIRILEDERCSGAVFHVPDDYWFLKPCLRKAPGETFMLRAPLTPPSMIMEGGGKGVRIVSEGYSICVPRGRCGELEARMPRDILHRVLLGAMHPEEAAELGLLEAKPPAALPNVLKTLSSATRGKGFYIWVTDRW